MLEVFNIIILSWIVTVSLPGECLAGVRTVSGGLSQTWNENHLH